jgi:hypothetical protein
MKAFLFAWDLVAGARAAWYIFFWFIHHKEELRRGLFLLTPLLNYSNEKPAG